MKLRRMKLRCTKKCTIFWATLYGLVIGPLLVLQLRGFLSHLAKIGGPAAIDLDLLRVTLITEEQVGESVLAVSR